MQTDISIALICFTHMANLFFQEFKGKYEYET